MNLKKNCHSFNTIHVTGITASTNIGETNRHLSTRVREHLATDKASHIFKHLHSNCRCKSMTSSECFKIIDFAETTFQLKIKEALHIVWDKPNLNQQVKHVNLKLIL